MFQQWKYLDRHAKKRQDGACSSSASDRKCKVVHQRVNVVSPIWCVNFLIGFLPFSDALTPFLGEWAGHYSTPLKFQPNTSLITAYTTLCKRCIKGSTFIYSHVTPTPLSPAYWMRTPVSDVTSDESCYSNVAQDHFLYRKSTLCNTTTCAIYLTSLCSPVLACSISTAILHKHCNPVLGSRSAAKQCR